MPYLLEYKYIRVLFDKLGLNYNEIYNVNDNRTIV